MLQDFMTSSTRVVQRVEEEKSGETVSTVMVAENEINVQYIRIL